MKEETNPKTDKEEAGRKSDKDAAYPKLELLVKGATPVVAVVGLIFGVWQFNRGQADQLYRQQQYVIENEKAELRRKRREKHLDLLTRLSVAAGKVAANLDDPKQARGSIQEFDILYWGECAFLEDRELEAELQNLHLDLLNLTDSYDAGDRVTEKTKRDREADLKIRAANLGKKLRNEMKKVFGEQNGT